MSPISQILIILSIGSAFIVERARSYQALVDALGAKDDVTNGMTESNMLEIILANR